jgi:Zn-dependent protease with chaperone function
MIQNKATYYYGEEQSSAHIEFLKNKLSIQITSNGEKRTIFWYYDQAREDGLNSFTYPGVPKQSLHIHSSETAQQLAQKIGKAAKQPNRLKALPLLKSLLVLLIILVLLYFYGLPWVAGKMANRFPVSYEKKLGEQMYQSMKGSFVIDKERTKYINEFFRQLNIPSKYSIQITVVKSNEVNAFAIPGGHIVVYTGILKGMKSYEELAALLTHEFTHIENRHTLKNLFQQFSSSIFFSMLFGNLDGVSSVLINNADGLKDLSYGRSLETESDENGALLLAQRNIDCKGFIQLFKLLQHDAGQEPPEYLSSHPNLDNRIKNIERLNYCKGQPLRDSTLHASFLLLQTTE